MQHTSGARRGNTHGYDARMRACFLGIDVGTSSTKCVVLAEDGAVLATGEGAYPASTPRPGWSEQDPALWCGQRGAVQDLAYAALRRCGRDDFYLARLMEKPPAAPTRALLLVALARLAARPEEAHTIVDQAVAAAGALARGRFKALANGVLRNFLRRRAELEAAAEQDEAARWQHPPWWLGRLRRAWPEDWQGILAAGNGRPPMALRVNRRRVTETDFLARLAQAGIEARATDGAILLARPLPVERLPGFAEAGRPPTNG